MRGRLDSRFDSPARARGRPWTVAPEEAILPEIARRALLRYGARALEASPTPFDDSRGALDEGQRASLRELSGVARAARVVRCASHVVVPWSLVKDAYLEGNVAAAVSPPFSREQFVEALPAQAHALVGFDALTLKAYGGHWPEGTALSAFLHDLYERGCSLEVISRYPLLAEARAFEGQGHGEGRRALRDERGRLRVTRRTAPGGAPSFEGALERGEFEMLAHMLVDGGESQQ